MKVKQRVKLRTLKLKVNERLAGVSKDVLTFRAYSLHAMQNPAPLSMSLRLIKALAVFQELRGERSNSYHANK
jgi:hypothetical protein